MTDRKRFVEFFKKHGIGFEDDQMNIRMTAQENAKVDGYIGFFVIFEFDIHGAFERLSIGE